MARIIIIEDEPVVMMVLREALQDEGHQVVTAANGRAGLDLACGTPMPDLVLADIYLPGLLGRRVVEGIRSEARLAEVPIILVTGAVPCVEDFPPEGSYQAVIGKPFDLAHVVETVARLLG